MSAALVTIQRATPVRPGLVLIVLFGVAAWLLATIGPAIESGPRFPTDAALYTVDGWTVSSANVDDSRPGLAIVSHTFVSTDNGTRATVAITTSPIAKAVYRAGAAVPFLGNGYTVEPLPASQNRESFIARRGDEAWLQVSMYGESRGQFGSGPLAWTLSTFDSIVGHPNDYYLARVVVPYTEANAQRAATLAEALFPRLAAYYAR